MALKKILITGANGKLGVRLIHRLARQYEIRAIVRSERAKHSLLRSLEATGLNPEVQLVSYNDISTLTSAAADCDHAVHLVGIIKETTDSSYVDAHEKSCETLVAAAESAGLKSIVYLSLIGSDQESENPCFASRGNAENILLSASVSAVVIRVPMVLGEDDFASLSLSRRAHSRFVPIVRPDSAEQPIYAGDVVDAMVESLRIRQTQVMELAGPESLTRAALIRRASAIKGKRPVIVSLPSGLLGLAAGVLERVSSNPPVTRAMLGVLDHDDDINAAPAANKLGITLTSLDDTLQAVIRH